MKMLVSVIITTLNRKNLLLETLASVRAQTWKAIEIIVVDDGSIPPTFTQAEADTLGIRYFHRTNSGQPASRNFGVSKASAEYIAFIDDDDLWMPQKLELQMAEILRGARWVYCDCEYFHHATGIAYDLHSRLHKPRSGKVFQHMVEGCFVSSPSVLVEKQLLINCGGFIEDRRANLGEDWFMWLKIASESQLSYVDQVLARYRVHPNSMLSGSNLARIEESHRIGIDRVFAYLPPMLAVKKTECLKHDLRRLARSAYVLGQSRAARSLIIKSIKLGRISHLDIIYLCGTFLPQPLFRIYHRKRGA